MHKEARVLMFRGFDEVQTEQEHPISGTPEDPPVPRNVTDSATVLVRLRLIVYFY